MPRSPRSVARRRAMAIVTVGATIASGSALLAPGTSQASSHREAPYISSDPTVDNTDTYAFNDKDGKNVNFIANWAPFSDPAGGPTFYPWATDAAYDINIDNNGDAKVDITYRWEFTNVDKRGTTSHGDKQAGTFLYADGEVKHLTDPTLLFKQTYKLTEIDKAGQTGESTKVLVPAGTAAPSNIGKATIPSYVPLRQEAVVSGTFAGGKSYVGQADDPFFLDLRVFDLLYGGSKYPFKEAGTDTLKHYNVNTIALQVPKADVAAGGSVANNPAIGVWSATSRRTTRTFNATNTAPGADAVKDPGPLASNPYAQVSRLGSPLVNEVVVPAQLKDTFNRITPDVDAGVQAVVDKVNDPEVPYLVKLLYKVPNPINYNHTTGAFDTAKHDRNDLFTVFLTGVPGVNNLAGNAVAKGPNAIAQRPAEYLRMNLSTPATANPKRLGVLGGDNQGYPNGRRLGDDITDITLQVAEGTLLYQGFGGLSKPAMSADAKATAKAVAGLGDGVNANEKPFLSVFPYIADPTSGSAVVNVKPQPRYQQKYSSSRGVVTINVFDIRAAVPGGTTSVYLVSSTGVRTLIGRPALNAAGTAIKAPFSYRVPGTARSATFLMMVSPEKPLSDANSAGALVTTTVPVNR